VAYPGSVLQALLLAFVAATIWKLSTAPAFLRGFATLLERPERGYVGWLGRLTQTQFIGGEVAGRPVTLVLRPKRRHQLGYLVVAVATAAKSRVQGLKPSEGGAVSSPSMREAIDTLVGRHHLALEVDEGWLKATWKPVGFFFFPGRFEAEKWRDVLVRMQQLAGELEGADGTRAGTATA